MAEFTVVFVDLTGSTGVFENLGNVKAVRVITRLTHWIGQVCEKHNGYVVKYLGDGVFILFEESHDAVIAASELQKIHYDRIEHWPFPLKMRLQIGMARGDVVTHDGDCYGDAVNVASRLSDLSGSEQILVNENVIHQLPDTFSVRSRCLGPLLIRGRTETCVVHRIEWQDEVPWLDLSERFSVAELPIYLGRDTESPRVSWRPVGLSQADTAA